MNDITRRIDKGGVSAWHDWISSDVLPDREMWTLVRDESIGQSDELQERMKRNATAINGYKRVLFTGRYWMTRDVFKSWKPCPDNELPVTALIENKPEQRVVPIDKLELVPEEIQKNSEISTLAELARLELCVEVVRLYMPNKNANGATSGKVLAVSKSYAAQSLGGNGIVIHDQAKLDRKLQPGEHVTVNYEAGKARVYNGIFFDVSAKSNYLNVEESNWLRMKMIEALSTTDDAPNDDQMIKEALLYALDKTAEMFPAMKKNLAKTDIKLSVNDVMPTVQKQIADKTGVPLDWIEDVAVIRPFENYR